MRVNLKKSDSKATIPFKTHDSDYGYDIVAIKEEEIAPNVWKYSTGISLQTEQKFSSFQQSFDVRPRSSIWKTGMVLANSIGTIDEDYTGEIMLIFYHVMPDMPRYKIGDKIAQISHSLSEQLIFKEVEEFKKTVRGSDGFGSTDKKIK